MTRQTEDKSLGATERLRRLRALRIRDKDLEADKTKEQGGDRGRDRHEATYTFNFWSGGAVGCLRIFSLSKVERSV